jgi:hypothetical protein
VTVPHISAVRVHVSLRSRCCAGRCRGRVAAAQGHSGAVCRPGAFRRRLPPRGIQAPFAAQGHSGAVFFANLRLTRMLRNIARALLGSQARASSCALRARSALKQRQQQSEQSIFTQQNPSSALVYKLFLHEHEPMQQDASISLRRRQHSAPGRSCNAPACIASHHQQFSFAAGSDRCFALRCAGAAAPMAAVQIQKWA